MMRHWKTSVFLNWRAGRQINYFKLQLLACGLEQDFVDVHVLRLADSQGDYP